MLNKESCKAIYEVLKDQKKGSHLNIPEDKFMDVLYTIKNLNAVDPTVGRINVMIKGKEFTFHTSEYEIPSYLEWAVVPRSIKIINDSMFAELKDMAKYTKLVEDFGDKNEVLCPQDFKNLCLSIANQTNLPKDFKPFYNVAIEALYADVALRAVSADNFMVGQVMEKMPIHIPSHTEKYQTFLPLENALIMFEKNIKEKINNLLEAK